MTVWLLHTIPRKYQNSHTDKSWLCVTFCLQFIFVTHLILRFLTFFFFIMLTRSKGLSNVSIPSSPLTKLSLSSAIFGKASKDTSSLVLFCLWIARNRIDFSYTKMIQRSSPITLGVWKSPVKSSVPWQFEERSVACSPEVWGLTQVFYRNHSFLNLCHQCALSAYSQACSHWMIAAEGNNAYGGTTSNLEQKWWLKTKVMDWLAIP